MESSFREVILKQLRERNKANDRFSELVNSHNELYEGTAGLRHENFQLNIQLEKLKQDNLNLQVKVEAGGGGEKSERYSAIEQKLFRVQEELTEVHRTKGANAQQLINLNLALQETEKERNVANEILKKKGDEIKTLQRKLADFEQKYHDSLQVNQTLSDEYQALHITCNSLETKLRQCQAENSELVQRWVEFKNHQVERMNQENSKSIKPNSDKRVSNAGIENSGPETSPKNGSLPTSPNADVGSPQKTLKRFTDSISDFFRGPKGPPPDSSNEPRYPVYYGCVAVTVPSACRCKWKAHDGEVTSVKYSGSGAILATGGSDRLIKLWTSVGNKCIQQNVLRGSNGGITNIDYGPQEQILVACSNDFAVRLWTIETQRLRLTLTGHAGKVLAARYLGYGSKLVSGSNDRTVKIWDVKSGSCVKTYLAGSSCNDIVTTDQSCVVSGHFDRKLRFYDTRAGSSASFELTVGGRITSLDTPADKSAIVCCTKDHTLEIVDLRNRNIVDTFSNDSFKVATDYSRCAFSPNGEYVAVGSSDGTLLAWNVTTKELETCKQEHDDPVISCSWGGGNLVTGDKNRHCVMWTDS